MVSHVLASVITPIGLDHMAWLGDTIAEIAERKPVSLKKKERSSVSRQNLQQEL